jgi:hypothetical protein
MGPTGRRKSNKPSPALAIFRLIRRVSFVCSDILTVKRHRIVFQSAAQETDMGKGEQRSNREKKKPKAEKNKIKAAPPASPFAMAKSNDKPGKK